MKRILTIAGALIALALVLGVVGIVLRALRWLLILAAIILVIGAVLGIVGRKDERA